MILFFWLFLAAASGSLAGGLTGEQDTAELGRLDELDGEIVGPVRGGGAAPDHGNAALIQADLAEPADSEAAYDTVERLRTGLDDAGDGEAVVGGNTAVNLDVQTASQRTTAWSSR